MSAYDDPIRLDLHINLKKLYDDSRVYGSECSVCCESQEAPPVNDEKDEDIGETDVDCGGTYCPACAIGLNCTSDTDCESGICNAG